MKEEIDKEPKEELKDDTETTEEQKDKVHPNNSSFEKKEEIRDEENSSSDNLTKFNKLSKEEKKKEKKEKKERKKERKEIKTNPQFSFIEKDEKPIKEKAVNKSKKKLKIEDSFNFNKENKFLGSDSPINSGAEDNDSTLSPSLKKRTPNVERILENKKRNKEKEEHQIKKKKELLESFLLTNPVVKLKGTTWNYLNIDGNTTGEKRETMVFMVGGGIRMEAFFEQLHELQKDFRIIAPYLPHELKDFDDYIAGINLILSHHKIKKVHLYGISLGGMICQYYLSKFPEKVLSAIFSHVFPPNPDFGSLCAKFQIKKYERAPSALRRCLLGLNIKEKDFKRDIPYVSDEAVHFWVKRVKRFSAQEEDILSRISALSDYNNNVSFTPSTFEKIDIPILIIDSERTEEFGKSSHSEMLKLFPKASSHFLEGHGHLQILVNQETISLIIGKWYLKNYWDKGKGL